MRYAALITCCFSGGFGRDRKFAVAESLPSFRFSDEVLYALALYIYSLVPPPNPNRMNATAARGEKIFMREGCANCHTPPLYTNNKLTLAEGFKPPADHPNRMDILPLSVGPTLVLRSARAKEPDSTRFLHSREFGIVGTTATTAP